VNLSTAQKLGSALAPTLASSAGLLCLTYTHGS